MVMKVLNMFLRSLVKMFTNSDIHHTFECVGWGMEWWLCKGKNLKPEKIGKSQQAVSPSLLQFLGSHRQALCSSSSWEGFAKPKPSQCHRPFGSSAQSGWILNGAKLCCRMVLLVAGAMLTLTPISFWPCWHQWEFAMNFNRTTVSPQVCRCERLMH